MSSNSLLFQPHPLLPPSQKHHKDSKDYNFKFNSHTSRYNSIIKTQIQSNNFNFPLILKACAHLSSLKQTQQFHSLLLKCHFINKHDVFILTALLNAYAACGNIDDARKVFEIMHERNVVTWNCMMNGFLRRGDVGNAVRCFDEMEERNLVTWNSMIGGYMKAGMLHEALMLFVEMRDMGFEADETTMVSIVSVICDMGLLYLARRVHGYIVRNEFSLDSALGVALITMYGKYGIIDAAYKVFVTIPNKNVWHWTSIITELANHGATEASFRVFSEMINSGIEPNYITFIAVLNACRHAGVAEEGLKYFNLMKCYNIEPRIEHYGCLIDLLGRCGRVEEAMEIACKLPIDPGIVVWSSLLAACENHEHVEIAEIVASKLIELEPKNGSPYILMSNLYAKKGMWEKLSKIRNTMEKRNVVKVAGKSCIEVDGRVHEFVAGDKFHVKCKKIYEILEEMKLNMRLYGYESVGSI